MAEAILSTGRFAGIRTLKGDEVGDAPAPDGVRTSALIAFGVTMDDSEAGDRVLETFIPALEAEAKRAGVDFALEQDYRRALPTLLDGLGLDALDALATIRVRVVGPGDAPATTVLAADLEPVVELRRRLELAEAALELGATEAAIEEATRNETAAAAAFEARVLRAEALLDELEGPGPMSKSERHVIARLRWDLRPATALELEHDPTERARRAQAANEPTADEEG
jgi:hypothetical protein